MILVPLPDHPYYLWQALVQAFWLGEHGWPVTFLVYQRPGRPSPQLRALMGAGIANWVVWDDWRSDATYAAAMKPWLVGRYLEAHPELVDESVLVCDPDCLPLRRWPDTTPGLLLGTGTDSYTGPGYLAGRGAWGPLCSLVGVDPALAGRHRGMGAQYVTQGLPGAWWQEVAALSVEAHRLLLGIPSPDAGYPVQAWCAEMYVTQLAAIRDGITPTAHPGMSMVWANGPLAEWETAGFFHDAGVQAEDGQHFCKITWQESPFGQHLAVDPDSASAPYVDLIRATANAWPHLTW